MVAKTFFIHTLPTLVFRSEHGGCPSEAADDAGPGARMQIRMAIQQPAPRTADQNGYPIGYPFGYFQLDCWIGVDYQMDMLGYSSEDLVE
jgi:hypothetical protein